MIIKSAKDISKAENFSALLYAPPGGGKTYTASFLKGKTLVIDIDRTTNVLAGNPNIDIVYADLNDVELLKNAGLAACPANAVKEVKEISGIIKLKSFGGSGALREFAEIILG